VIGALDIDGSTLEELGVRRMAIGRLRDERGFPRCFARAEMADGRRVQVEVPLTGRISDAVAALLAAAARGDA
jgi:hypothetical protein